MSDKIDTGFGFSFEVIKINKNIELENSLANKTTIFTPNKTKVEL